MMENQELILEQIAILKQQRFGRRSEKMDVIDGQMSLFFNELEIPERFQAGKAFPYSINQKQRLRVFLEKAVNIKI